MLFHNQPADSESYMCSLAWKASTSLLVEDTAAHTLFRKELKQLSNELETMVLEVSISGSGHVIVQISVPHGMPLGQCVDELKNKTEQRLKTEYPSLSLPFWEDGYLLFSDETKNSPLFSNYINPKN